MTEFKVGDTVRWNNPVLSVNQWQNLTIEKISEDGTLLGTDSVSGCGGFSPNWEIVLAKSILPPITLNAKYQSNGKLSKIATPVFAKYQSNGKLSKIATPVFANEKYVVVEYESGTIGQMTVKAFHQEYVPYVEKKIVKGFVVLRDFNGIMAFQPIYPTEEEARHAFEENKKLFSDKYDLVAIIPIEYSI